MLSVGNDDPPQRFRVVWELGEGFVAAVLLLAGGLKALQTASIAAALPISVIMSFMAYGLLKSLSRGQFGGSGTRSSGGKWRGIGLSRVARHGVAVYSSAASSSQFRTCSA